MNVREICLILDVFLAIEDVDTLRRFGNHSAGEVIDLSVGAGSRGDFIDAVGTQEFDIVDIIPTCLAYKAEAGIDFLAFTGEARSEERRVGKECRL